MPKPVRLGGWVGGGMRHAVEILVGAAAYKMAVEGLQAKGYQIAMVQFIDGVWVITYLVKDEECRPSVN